MSETRKLAAILVADVVGFSRLAGSDEERTLARIRGLRGDLIDPAVAAHHGRIVKGTGDGALIEFRSVVDAVRCALEVQTGMAERNAGVPREKRLQLRIGVHLGDVVEERDGDLMGDGVNIAARLEGVAKPGTVCLSEDAYRQVKGRLEMTVRDLGPTHLKNIAEQMHAYLVEGEPPRRPAARGRRFAAALAASMFLIVVGAVGWDRMSGDPPTLADAPAPQTAASSGLALAVPPAATPAAPEPTIDATPPASNKPMAASHAGSEHQAKPPVSNPSDAEPAARKSLRSARLKPPPAEPAPPRPAESAWNSSQSCFISAAQTNGNHSCAYLRDQSAQPDPAPPRLVESASNASQPCFISAAQTNGTHSCAYLRGD